MKRTAGVVATLLGITTIAGLPAPAAAHGGGEHIQLTARPISEHYEDVGKEGESIGDYFTFSDRLKRQGDRVGHATGRCDVTRVTRRSYGLHCNVTVVLNGRGQLTIQGAITFKRGRNADPVLAITGGTGDFAGASGEFVLVERRTGPARYNIHLAG